MIYPIDIHTHHRPVHPGRAIVNCFPETFDPQPQEYYSVGIHPWRAGNSFRETDEQVRLLTEVAHHPQVIAIGEAGLDKLTDAPLPVQLAAFEYQARLAMETGKPLIIHLVKATDELLKVKKELRPQNPWIIHGFRGKAAVAQMFLQHGFYLSYGKKYQAESLCATPVERLLLETDESIVPIETLYEQAATLRHIPLNELTETIGQNIRHLFFTR